MTQYKYDVIMSCGGCSGAVTKALAKLEGIDKFDVSLETQKSEILAAIQETGKTAKVAEQ
ncbi:Cytosolic copper metallochaperone [Haplosporangium gracile]|nr:Cytosolic copper metallochaperone [Haplosporangium gracile]